MTKNVYAIRDNKMASFNAPVLVDNDAVAMRQFGDLVQRGQDSVMSIHPEDFTLYRLGIYDMDKGKFENLDCPLALATGTDYLTEDK